MVERKLTEQDIEQMKQGERKKNRLLNLLSTGGVLSAALAVGLFGGKENGEDKANDAPAPQADMVSHEASAPKAPEQFYDASAAVHEETRSEAAQSSASSGAFVLPDNALTDGFVHKTASQSYEFSADEALVLDRAAKEGFSAGDWSFFISEIGRLGKNVSQERADPASSHMAFDQDGLSRSVSEEEFPALDRFGKMGTGILSAAKALEKGEKPDAAALDQIIGGKSAGKVSGQLMAFKDNFSAYADDVRRMGVCDYMTGSDEENVINMGAYAAGCVSLHETEKVLENDQLMGQIAALAVSRAVEKEEAHRAALEEQSLKVSDNHTIELTQEEGRTLKQLRTTGKISEADFEIFKKQVALFCDFSKNHQLKADGTRASSREIEQMYQGREKNISPAFQQLIDFSSALLDASEHLSKSENPYAEINNEAIRKLCGDLSAKDLQTNLNMLKANFPHVKRLVLSQAAEAYCVSPMEDNVQMLNNYAASCEKMRSIEKVLNDDQQMSKIKEIGCASINENSGFLSRLFSRAETTPSAYAGEKYGSDLPSFVLTKNGKGMV